MTAQHRFSFLEFAIHCADNRSFGLSKSVVPLYFCLYSDISSKRIEIARNKFKKYDFINFLCEDAEEFNFKNQYDRVMVFNAFPHFPNPKALIKNLAKAVKSGGTVTVAHDRGRKDLDNHHKSVQASKISNGLISENALEEIFKSTGLVNIYKKATEDIYIVSGIKA